MPSMPQIHGACRDQLAHAARQVEIELNSANDNPLVGAAQSPPGGLPAWADWQFTLDPSTSAAQFGNDYLAGGAGHDQLFAQAGDDTLQGFFLVRGVALDRLDEVRDEVVAALELHVHLRKGVLHRLTQPDEAVVNAHRPQADDDEDGDEDPEEDK